jgi:hypothetical protein
LTLSGLEITKFQPRALAKSKSLKYISSTINTGLPLASWAGDDDFPRFKYLFDSLCRYRFVSHGLHD